MRCLFLCCVVAATAPACVTAQEVTPTPDRAISRPTFLPLQGQVYGETGYGYAQTDGSLFDGTGANIGSTSDTTNDVMQGLAYGITNALSVRASISYDWASDHRATAQATTDSNRHGFNNPSFGASYRVLDQGPHPVSLDIYADWSPDVFAVKTASGTQSSGDVLGDVAFGFAVGRETRLFTIRGAFTERYAGAVSTVNQSAGTSSSTPSAWVSTLGLQTQTRLASRLSVNAGYGYTFDGRTVADQTGKGVALTHRVGDTQNVNVGLNYDIVPNRLVGSLGYRHSFIGNRNDVFADPASNQLQTRAGDLVSVSLRYLLR